MTQLSARHEQHTAAIATKLGPASRQTVEVSALHLGRDLRHDSNSSLHSISTSLLVKVLPPAGLTVTFSVGCTAELLVPDEPVTLPSRSCPAFAGRSPAMPVPARKCWSPYCPETVARGKYIAMEVVQSATTASRVGPVHSMHPSISTVRQNRSSRPTIFQTCRLGGKD